MRFHVPSFLYYLERGLPSDIAITHHYYVCYVMSSYPIKMDMLQETIIDALYSSFESPIGTPQSTEERSLIGGLLDEHWETLERTLRERNTYLKKGAVKRVCRGEVTLYEYQVNLRILMKICKEARLEYDTRLIAELIDAELFDVKGRQFVSLRKMEKLIYSHTGKAYSKRRINEAFQHLESQKKIHKLNGFRHIFGREVRV